MKGVFITGTGTGVGKTWLGCQLVAYLHNKGIKVIPQKPVESGCVLNGNKLEAEDALSYFRACKGSTKIEQINPFKFAPICSPARASVLSNTPLLLNDLLNHINSTVSKGDFVVLEGAGGIYSPLTTDALNIDLAIATALPIVLIANDTLGCINPILLSLKAIKDAELTCLAIILNEVTKPVNSDTDNAEELKRYTHVPIIHNHFNDNDASLKIASLL